MCGKPAVTATVLGIQTLDMQPIKRRPTSDLPGASSGGCRSITHESMMQDYYVTTFTSPQQTIMHVTTSKRDATSFPPACAIYYARSVRSVLDISLPFARMSRFKAKFAQEGAACPGSDELQALMRTQIQCCEPSFQRCRQVREPVSSKQYVSADETKRDIITIALPPGAALERLLCSEVGARIIFLPVSQSCKSRILVVSAPSSRTQGLII